MLRYLSSSVALLVGLLTAACGQHADADTTPLTYRPAPPSGGKAVTERVAYGSAASQFGQLRVPAGRGPWPVVVVIHGGCWLAEVADLQSTAPLADALRREGWATWNIEYRRLGEAGGGWPGTFLDVATGVDYVRTLARRFPLDTARVVVIGHSAGGHLALWAAARGKLPAASAIRTPGVPLRLRGAISLGGPADLRPFSTMDDQICGTHVITQLLGGSPQEMPARWREASPAALLPLGVPTRLIVGTRDPVVPADAAKAYERQAHAVGDDARYLPVPDVAHMEEIDPGGGAWSVTRAYVRELL